jgi:hypothetical protein
MTFFDCVYLKVAKFYSRKKESMDGFSGLFVLALMQSFNIVALFLIICLVFRKNVPLPPWSFVLLSIILIFANGVRYYSIDFSTLDQKWEEIGEKKRSKMNQIISIYVAGSTIIWLILLIYTGGRKN